MRRAKTTISRGRQAVLTFTNNKKEYKKEEEEEGYKSKGIEINLSKFKLVDKREEEDMLIKEDLVFIIANNSK
jgi:hypothetical protein